MRSVLAPIAAVNKVGGYGIGTGETAPLFHQAAASMSVALPTLVVCFSLQRYFIAGLTIGAEKG